MNTFRCHANLALPILLVFAATSISANPLPDKPHIYVEGRGEIEVEPDHMAITVELRAADGELAAAKSDLDGRSRTLIDQLIALGVDHKDLSTTSLQIGPAYEYEDGRRVRTGVQVYRQVDITLRDLGLYPSLMQALVDANISSSLSTRFLVSDADNLVDQALHLALDNAAARAEELAASQGKRLGEIYSISEFDARNYESYSLRPSSGIGGQSVHIERALAFAMEAPAEYEPFEPGIMTANATVYVVFLIR